MSIFDKEEHFKVYWKRRQYKHSEEKIEEMRIARKFYYAGWDNADYFFRVVEAKLKGVKE